MCDFLTIASIAVGAAQSVMQYQAADQQYQSQKETERQNAINASIAAENQYSNIGIRSQQEEAARVQQKMETNIDSAKTASTIEVAAAAGGVSGLSVDAVLQDVYAQKGRNDAALDVNQRMSRDYLMGEMKSAEAGGQGQINSVPIPEKPSFAPYLISAFGSGLNAYANYKKGKG